MPKRKWESTGFGPRLKAAREASGKSQRQLAEDVSVDVVTVSRLERGEQEPAWPLVLAFCRALDVSCEIFGGLDDVEASDETPKMGRPRKSPPAVTGSKASGEKAKKRNG